MQIQNIKVTGGLYSSNIKDPKLLFIVDYVNQEDHLLYTSHMKNDLFQNIITNLRVKEVWHFRGPGGVEQVLL